MTPKTLLRWHRELVRFKWARYSKRRPGRPPPPAEVQELILGLAKENPRWGYKRIQGELLKLGIKVSATAIRKLLGRRGLGPAPRRGGTTWRQFLAQQASSMIMLVMLGFLLQWPMLLTLAMFPVLVLVYRQLAIAEEREVTQRFGNLYGDYSRSVPRFIPRWKDRAPDEPRDSAPARTLGPSRRHAA